VHRDSLLKPTEGVRFSGACCTKEVLDSSARKGLLFGP